MKKKRPQPHAHAPVSARPQPSHGGDVELVYGFRAALAVLATRPNDVRRVACVRDAVADVERALGSRAEDTSITVLSDQEIERITRSPQHEGVCVETRARRWASSQDVADLLLKKGGIALALDRVRNSYNIGAIVRSAAFFGVDVILLGAPAPHPGLDPNAIRVAEGGAEHLLFARTTDLADTLSRLRQRGVKVVGTDGDAGTNALGYCYERPVVLVLGNEREGLGPRVRVQCDVLVAVRPLARASQKNVESLNVAVTAGVLIAELSRMLPA